MGRGGVRLGLEPAFAPSWLAGGRLDGAEAAPPHALPLPSPPAPRQCCRSLRASPSRPPQHSPSCGHPGAAGGRAPPRVATRRLLHSSAPTARSRAPRALSRPPRPHARPQGRPLSRGPAPARRPSASRCTATALRRARSAAAARAGTAATWRPSTTRWAPPGEGPFGRIISRLRWLLPAPPTARPPRRHPSTPASRLRPQPRCWRRAPRSSSATPPHSRPRSSARRGAPRTAAGARARNPSACSSTASASRWVALLLRGSSLTSARSSSYRPRPTKCSPFAAPPFQET
jgi:hypothetical protein